MQAQTKSANHEEYISEHLRMQKHSIAVGRLGRLYNALDTNSGRLLTVESIDVTQDECKDANLVVKNILEAELQQLHMSHRHPNLFYYDSIHCMQNRILLCSNTATTCVLSNVLKNFGSLHGMVVRQYIQAIVKAIQALHKSGNYYGGLSLSSIFVYESRTVNLAAWFPSVHSIQLLQTHGVLTDLQFGRAAMQRQTVGQETAQDIRSIGYVMIEMLTGTRVRGHLVDKHHLLRILAPDSMEQHFLRALLSAKCLDDVIDHQYLRDNPHPTGGIVLQGSQSLIEQRRIIETLTEQELHKCQELQRQHTLEIRAWFAQFEKRYRRKPNMTERPTSVVRLHGRLQMLSERIVMLETRLQTVHKSFYRSKSETKGEDLILVHTHEMLAIPSDVIPPDEYKRQDKKLQTIDVNIEPVSPRDIDERRRSPAQKAFLKRLSVSSQAKTGSQSLIDNAEEGLHTHKSAHSRDTGNQLMHQRKELLHVIDDLEARNIASKE